MVKTVFRGSKMWCESVNEVLNRPDCMVLGLCSEASPAARFGWAGGEILDSRASGMRQMEPKGQKDCGCQMAAAVSTME